MNISIVTYANIIINLKLLLKKIKFIIVCANFYCNL